MNDLVGPNASTSSFTIVSLRKYGKPPMNSRLGRSSGGTAGWRDPTAAPPAFATRPTAARFNSGEGCDGPNPTAAPAL